MNHIIPRSALSTFDTARFPVLDTYTDGIAAFAARGSIHLSETIEVPHEKFGSSLFVWMDYKDACGFLRNDPFGYFHAELDDDRVKGTAHYGRSIPVPISVLFFGTGPGSVSAPLLTLTMRELLASSDPEWDLVRGSSTQGMSLFSGELGGPQSLTFNLPHSTSLGPSAPVELRFSLCWSFERAINPRGSGFPNARKMRDLFALTQELFDSKATVEVRSSFFS